MSSPQRYSKGVTNVAPGNTMGQLIVPDPTSVQVLMRDFQKYDPGEWFITRVTTDGATEGTDGVGDASGGILAVVTSAGDDDSVFYQYKADTDAETASELFTLESGKKVWFKSRLKVNDADTCDVLVAMQNADTTPLTSPADTVLWRSDDGDANLDFQVYAASTSTYSETGIASIVDDTYFTVGFYFDGGKMEYFFNDVSQGESSGTVPSNAMTIGFGIQNGSAAASTLSIDYICAIKER